MAQLIAVYFNCYKGRKYFFFISICSGDIIKLYVELTTQFSVQEWTLQKCLYVIRFHGRQK